MGKFLFATLILAIVIGTSSIAQANLLVNPSFEDGTLTSWTVDWAESNIGTSTVNPQSGTYHARNYNDGGRYQDVSITGGEQYRLTGYAYIPAGGQTEPWNTFIGLRMFDAVGGQLFNWQYDMKDLPRNLYNLADSNWVAAPATAVIARVRFGTWASLPYSPANPTDFDNFDFTPIPEPTSLLLLGSGLVGLAAFTRKRRI